MDTSTLTFEHARPRLLGIAYRMLGSRAEAEEVVQDVLLRWHETAQTELENAEAWLVTVTTRVSIDRLCAAKVQRDHYVGPWIPEPTLSEYPASTIEDAELIGHGGGKVPSFDKPLLGGRRIAQLYLATSLRCPGALRVELGMINGEWGLLRFVDGILESVH